MRWQVYRRLARRGFVRVEASNADRVRVRSLGCWLRVVGEGTTTRVRLALGSEGDELFPTAEEAEQRAEQARTADHAALVQARAEIARLRTQLGRRKR